MSEGERIDVNVELRADPPEQRLPLPRWMMLEEHIEIDEVFRFGPIAHRMDFVHGDIKGGRLAIQWPGRVGTARSTQTETPQNPHGPAYEHVEE